MIHRLSEIDHVNFSPDLCSQTDKTYRLEHKEGPVPQSTSGEGHQFKVFSMDGITVKPSRRDSGIKIRNEVVLVENFIDGGMEYIAGKEYRCKESLFVYPFDSRVIGIYKVSKLSMKVKYFQMEESVQKYIRLPYDDFVVVPFIHSNESLYRGQTPLSRVHVNGRIECTFFAQLCINICSC